MLALSPAILLGQSTSLTTTLGPEIDVGAVAVNSEPQYQSNLRVDPADPDRMMITLKNSTDETATAIFNTLDGGSTWDYLRLTRSGDPEIIYDQNGTAYWTFIDQSRGSKSSARISKDGGVTWSDRIAIASQFIDHPHTAVDRTPSSPFYNSVYFAGRVSGQATLSVVRSRDQGKSWQTTPKSLSGSADKGFVHQPWVMRDGTLVVPVKEENGIISINGSYGGNIRNIYSVRSTDGGVTFEDPVFLANRDSPAQIGPGGGVSRADAGIVSGMWNGIERLYFAYPYMSGNNRPTEIRLCTSDDAGLSWSESRVVTPPPPSGKGYTIPSIMVNPDGVIGLQFFEVNSSNDFNVYFMASADGGDTFSDPIRVSTQTGKEISFQYISRELGGDQIYSDAAADGSFRLVWTDNRDRDNLYSIYYRKVMVKPADLTASNDAPVSLSLIGGNVNDGAPIGTVVGTLRTSDPDVGDTHTYTLVGGASAQFQITGNALKLAASPRYAIQSFLEVIIRSTDTGGLFTERTIQVGINPPPPTPTRIDTGGYVSLGGDSSSYESGQDLSGTISISPDRRSAALTGNRWKKFPLPYPVVAGTVLEVTVNGADVGEITAIGLDSNNVHDDNLRIFQLGGSDSSSNMISITPAYAAGSGAKKYIIPVGTHYTGNSAWLVLLADDDANASANMTFSEIRIHEPGASGSTSLFQKWSASRSWGSIPTSLRNPGDDPDGDGRSNLLEMALGQNPAVADSDERMRTAFLRNPNTSSTISLFYPKFEQGLTYRMEVSNSLQSNSWSSAGVSAETFDAEQGMYRQTYTTPTGVPRSFARLRVSQ